MNNKKLIAKGLIVSILLLNTPTNVMADMARDYKLSVVDKEEDNSLKENKFEEFFNNLFDKFKQPKEVIKVNKNIRVGTVKEVTIGDGEYVPNLDGNVEGYETIRVTTTGNKKLVKEDYDNLRTSGIPKVDLSNSKSDVIPEGAFNRATHLTEFKFPQGVTRIEGDVSKGAFQRCTSLTGDLTIPNTVEVIGNSAFADCINLNGTLTIPSSVKIIEYAAFFDCKFVGTLTIPNSVKEIGQNAFYNCTEFTGNLIIPDSVTTIDKSAFERCSGFTGNLIIGNSVRTIKNGAFMYCTGISGDVVIPNTVTTIERYAFNNLDNANRIVIRVTEDDYNSNYKEEMINNLPNTNQTVIDLPYDFDISGTWIKNTSRTIGKPIIEKGKGEISLYIPAPYNEENINITKDNKQYELPIKNEENKYIFKEIGLYQVEIVTTLGNLSNITFSVEDSILEEIEEAIKNLEQSKSPEDIENVRDLVNALPESSKKDEFQDRLDKIFPNITLETQNKTSNFDIYIKSQNSLSLSLETSSIAFENFSGIDDLEQLNAINFTVGSSLPYQIKAYLPNEIRGTKTQSIMDKQILNIRKNGGGEYKTFSSLNIPITLSETESSGVDINHSLDIKLKGGIPHDKDIYRATVKLEIQQK